MSQSNQIKENPIRWMASGSESRRMALEKTIWK